MKVAVHAWYCRKNAVAVPDRDKVRNVQTPEGNSSDWGSDVLDWTVNGRIKNN
jgi:hypothetical protein